MNTLAPYLEVFDLENGVELDRQTFFRGRVGSLARYKGPLFCKVVCAIDLPGRHKVFSSNVVQSERIYLLCTFAHT